MDAVRIWMEFCLVGALTVGVHLVIVPQAAGLLLLPLTVVQSEARLPRPQLVVVQPVLAD